MILAARFGPICGNLSRSDELAVLMLTGAPFGIVAFVGAAIPGRLGAMCGVPIVDGVVVEGGVVLVFVCAETGPRPLKKAKTTPVRRIGLNRTAKTPSVARWPQQLRPSGKGSNGCCYPNRLVRIAQGCNVTRSTSGCIYRKTA